MTGSEKPRVFVTRKIPAAGLDRIVAACEAEVWPDPLPPPREVLLKKVAGCEGVLTLLTDKADAEFMEAAGPQLKVISNFAVGYNNVDVGEASKRGIRVGNTPGVLTESTADIAFALLMAAARRIVETEKYIHAGKWKTWEPLGHIGVDLQGKTVGIVGLGRIGHAFAKRCYGGWGMQVLYHNRKRNEAAEMELNARYADMDTLLRESDFVSVHCDLNDTTRGLFNAAAFAKMKKTAIFINTSRGPVVLQHDLYEALKSGSIFAAGLDVTDPEPILLDDPLLTLPNCVIVPHIASATPSSRNGMADISADNLLAGLRDDVASLCESMSERKPPGMTWETFAEEKIRAATASGTFDNLPGFGKPIPGLDEPHDEWWWIKQKMRQEKLSFLPPALQLRSDLEKELTRIWTLPNEDAVRTAVTNLNERIRDANFACLWGPPSTTMPLDVEHVLSAWHERNKPSPV